MHFADHRLRFRAEEMGIDRMLRHQFGNKGFHAGAGQPVGIGERDVEEMMAQRIPERRLSLLIAAAAQFGKQVRGEPLAKGGDK